MTTDLKKLGRQWLTKLIGISSQGGFVGEIDLSETQTLTLSHQLCPFIKKVSYFTDEEASVLAVVTVNLAYYFYEAKDGVSLLHHLRPENYDREKEIGERIETLLVKLNIISPRRPLPYRYIGLYIRQAIVTKRYLPRLSRFINRFDKMLGIKEREQLVFEHYKTIVNFMIEKQRYQTGILIEMLKEPVGFKLVQTICFYIDQVRTGKLKPEQLKQLKGFRKGFWDAFELLYKEKDNTFTKVNPIYKYPSFIYHPDENNIGLSFDEIGVSNKAYQIIVDGDKQLVTKGFVPFEDEDQLHNQTTVYIDKQFNFSLNTWVPDCKSPFQALFDCEKGYLVSSINHPKQKIRPGSYYLITLASISNDTKEKLRLDFSTTLDLESEEWYEIWPINLEPGVDLDKLGKCVENNSFLGLKWEDPKFFPGTIPESGVFVANLPKLIIRGWENLKKRYQLTIEYPDTNTIHRITENDLTCQGKDAFVSFMPQVNQLGIIKLTNMGFSSFNPDITELKFIILPNHFRIQWSHHLLEVDERPSVSFKFTADPEMEWTQEYIKTKQDRDIVYTFAPNTCFVNGQSTKIKGLNIQLNFLYAQAYPDFPPEPSTRDFIWASSLTESFDFIICGHKRCVLELGIIGEQGIVSIWKNADERPFRKKRILSVDLKDGLAGSKVRLGRFAIKFDNSWKETDCTFIDETAFIEAVINCNKSVLKYLYQDDLKNIFQKATNVVNTVDIPYHIELDRSNLPDRIIHFLTFLKLGYQIFDAQDYVDFSKNNFSNADYYDWLKWYNESKRNPGVLLKTPQTDMPPIDRWKRTIETYFTSVKQFENLPKLFYGWENDIVDPFASPKSKLSTLDKNNELRRAAFYYRKKNYDNALKMSFQLQDESFPKPVRVIAKIIDVLSKLNKWKFDTLTVDTGFSDSWDILENQINTLNNLFQNNNMINFNQIFSSPENTIQLLTLMEENVFTDMIKNILEKKWYAIEQMSLDFPIILYLLFKNKSLRNKIGLESKTIQYDLRQLQYKQIVPYDVQL